MKGRRRAKTTRFGSRAIWIGILLLVPDESNFSSDFHIEDGVEREDLDEEGVELKVGGVDDGPWIGYSMRRCWHETGGTRKKQEGCKGRGAEKVGALLLYYFSNRESKSSRLHSLDSDLNLARP
jgi:hypothetical protein